jgi:hypothetical protein
MVGPDRLIGISGRFGGGGIRGGGLLPIVGKQRWMAVKERRKYMGIRTSLTHLKWNGVGAAHTN